MANNIDLTENGYIQRNFEVAKELQDAGLEMEKYWVAAKDGKDCELCQRNEADGWIPLDQPFSSGHQRPLGHPGCRCDLLTRQRNIVLPTR